jgi:hypothetical protein
LPASLDFAVGYLKDFQGNDGKNIVFYSERTSRGYVPAVRLVAGSSPRRTRLRLPEIEASWLSAQVSPSVRDLGTAADAENRREWFFVVEHFDCLLCQHKRKPASFAS